MLLLPIIIRLHNILAIVKVLPSLRRKAAPLPVKNLFPTRANDPVTIRVYYTS